jgi:RNA polymerase sigma factor (sigma-70 family)
MLTEKEAQELVEKYSELKSKYEISLSSQDKKNFEKHQALCLEKFKYMISIRTSRYKNFSNYEDLNQEGAEALLLAMASYNPKKNENAKGNLFFWWAHKYIDTRIARKANLHTAIRFPLTFSKENVPHKENVMPLIIDKNNLPDKILEAKQSALAISNGYVSLSEDQKNILNLAYGLNGKEQMPIHKISEALGVTKNSVSKLLKSSLKVIKETIKKTEVIGAGNV